MTRISRFSACGQYFQIVFVAPLPQAPFTHAIRSPFGLPVYVTAWQSAPFSLDLPPPNKSPITVLSDQQIRNFCSAGYCVSRVAIPDELATRAVEKVWELSPPSFQANKPRTWQGTVRDCCKTQSIDDRGGRVKFRECLRGERWLYDLTAGNPDVLALVADLIGDPVEPEYVRGLYPVFPTRPRSPQGHCDRHKFQVGVVLYLSDVLPRGGGFTVWPGSHYSIAKHHGTLGGEDRLETFEAALAALEASTRPVEETGPTGTLVLWHQRLVHTAGRNTRRAVRHATLCDFKNQAFLAAADDKADDLWQTWSSRTQHIAASPASSVNQIVAI